MAMGSTHSLTEMNNRNISRGEKGVRCLGLPILPPPRADCLEIWETQPPGNLWACTGIALPSLYHIFFQFWDSDMIELPLRAFSNEWRVSRIYVLCILQ